MNKLIKQSQLYNVLNGMLAEQAALQARVTPYGSSPIGLELAKQMPLYTLLAEDRLVNQKVVLQHPQCLGYPTNTIGNALKVREALPRQSFDVTLMEVQMPEMDRLGAATRICQEWSYPLHPSIVAINANAMQGDREECQNGGIDDDISKPLQIETLVCVLSKFQRLSRTLEVTAVEVLTQSVADSAINSEALQVLQDIVGKDAATMIVEVMDSYLEDAHQLLQALHTATDTGDAGGRDDAAHTLNSSSVKLGATKLYQLCQDVEDMNKGGTTIAAPALVSQLETEYEQVKAILHTERQRDQRYR